MTDTPTPEKQAGPVIETVRELLRKGSEQVETVVAIFAKLVRENESLTRRLAELLSKNHKSESIDPKQLQLLLDEAQKLPEGTARAANERLQEASDPESKDVDALPKPPKQPPVRMPAPDHLERVPNPIAVRDEERTCPQCGADRTCIGHDKTEVIELIPAKVIVRVDTREVLACEQCEGEMVRAPAGDKVVSGGKYGPHLVADLVVGKYDEGMPLDRPQRGIFVSTRDARR